MKCYYLVLCYRNMDNYDAYNDRVEYGVWAVKADAISRADELNQSAKKEWDTRVRDVRQAVVTRQRRWDTLHAAGLSEGPRPQHDPAYDKEWSPGVGGISYYEVEETEFFPPNKALSDSAH